MPHATDSLAPGASPFAKSSRTRLTRRDLGRFPSDTLFDRIGRAVCHAGCLPRKELFEAWEVARRVRRVCRGGRVVDLAGGHGMLAMAMLLLDDSSPSALVVDTGIPASAGGVHDAIVATWPRLSGRIAFASESLDDVALGPDDIVVASHACGSLTDRVLDRATAAHARVAVLPCCHDHAIGDAGALGGWVDGSLAIDIERVHTLERRAYRVRTHTIPSEITPKNRLLIACPALPGGSRDARGAQAG